MLYLLIRLAILGTVLYVAFFVSLAVGVGAALAGTGVALTEFVTTGMRRYRGDAPLDELRILPPKPDKDGEPAYRSYWFGPVVVEFAQVVRESGENTYGRLRLWIEGVQTEVLNRNPSTTWKVAAFLPVVGADVGLVVGGALGGAVLALVALVDGTLLVVVVGLGYALGSVLRVVELGFMWVRGITVECPQCHERVTRPIYRCSGEGGCDAAHKSLVPGTLGIFYRVCRCGRSLPTLMLIRKLHLVAQCQHCGHQLPLKGLSAPTLHVPVAGGPQVGKSVFMFAAVQRLHDAAGGDAANRDFWADESFAKTFLAARGSIRNPDQMRKTTATRPKAYNIYLGKGLHRRLVYLYDTAGEIYDDSGALAQAGFYTHTKGVVICIDPFSLAGLRKRVDRATLDRVRALASDPKSQVERITENLREHLKVSSSRKLGVRAAVVVTKADALSAALVKHPYADLPREGSAPSRFTRDDAVRTWISDVGVRADIVASVRQNFEASSFFVVSHIDADAVGRPASRGENDDPAAPLQWLLEGGKVR